MNPRRGGACLGAALAPLVYSASAWAHPQMSPAVALTKHAQLFTLAVPTEKEDAATTKVELAPASGFAIDSFVPSAGWTRKVQATGSGEETRIRSVSWSGGNVPSEEDAVFQFLASADTAQTYSFKVRQTYSDGSVVDWVGPESSETPAPQVEFESSLGGGGGNDTLAIVAIAIAAAAAALAVLGLATRSGGRALA
jgi:uncharacterized protein YcnI